MRLGLSLSADSITSQKIGAGFTGILDEYSGAAAAYSVRRLSSTYTDGLIRVRRSSDDTEQDIGFDANGDLDTTALLAFVNEDVNTYTSDFSSTEDLGEFNGTGAAVQSIGGVDDAYKFTTITGTGQMFSSTTPFSGKGGGNSFRVQADVYLPSTNAEIDKVRIWTGYGTEVIADVTATDTWTSIDETITITSGSTLRFQAYDGNDLTPTTTEANVFYLKNIVVTQTTADGAITTWYDQAGSNDATNATESEQPLVVSGGSVVTLDGYPCLDGDIGADTMLQATNVIDTVGDVAIFSTYALKTDGTEANQITFEIGNGTSTHRIHDTLGRGGAGKFGIDIRGATDYDFGNATGVALDDIYLNSILSETNGFYINGTQQTSNNLVKGGSTVDALTLFNRGGGSFPFKGKFFEFIFFASDQSANRTGIESNINDHFTIYP